ncbi:MAG TPA: potassium channel family protein [Gaiellaceae bacterium]|nr:potassium channel family protein [Gaiellaceae bacterium]
MGLLSDRRIEKMNKAVISGRILPYLALSIIAITAVAGFAAWVLSPRGFDGLGEAMWWAAQTVTTVGYGDVVPESNGGKVIGILIMAFGVSAVSFITAVVTSAFLAWHQARLADERAAGGLTPHEQATHELLQRIDQRLESLERRLSS